MAPNFEAPSLSNSKVTYQPEAPCGSNNADACVTWRPKTSAGAKMYLLKPPRSQLTIVAASFPLLPP